MKYLAVLGREPDLSLAELEALFDNVEKISSNLAIFDANKANLNNLGGCLKIAIKLDEKPLDYLSNISNNKITFGLSDYSKKANKKSVTTEALKLKKILVRHGHSVRVVPNEDVVLSTATSLHNGLSGKNDHKVELIKFNNDYYRVIGVQDIDAYAKRDQARPARDAKVGMLPPKLAQILINLCGPLPEGSTILDPFCGTGVVLQEALLMGYNAYGTDIDFRMIEFSKKNLTWLVKNRAVTGDAPGGGHPKIFCEAKILGEEGAAGPVKTQLFATQVGDATTYKWQNTINVVACESYLGKPMSNIPNEIRLKTEKEYCKEIIIGFLKNLGNQIKSGTPVVVAIPAWLRNDGAYSRLEILDLLPDMGYNVNNKSREGLLYCRDGQIVARDIIILRKK